MEELNEEFQQIAGAIADAVDDYAVLRKDGICCRIHMTHC